jgi:hypothetical protein
MKPKMTPQIVTSAPTHNNTFDAVLLSTMSPLTGLIRSL